MKNSISGTHWVFIALSIVSLGFGIKNYFDEQAIFAAYEPATATLTDWIPDPHPDASGYCPVYEYKTQAGEARSYTGNACKGQPDPSAIGRKQAEIYYNPENPYAPVETKGWFGSEGSGLILGVVGFAFFQGLGWFTAMYERGQKRRTR